MPFLFGNSLVLPGMEGGGPVLPSAEGSVTGPAASAETARRPKPDVRASWRCPEKQTVKGNVLFFAF